MPTGNQLEMNATMLPHLSICVPSRNRQKYLQQTIIDILASPRADFELVVSDNSTDPDIMIAFVAAYQHDKRLRFLSSPPETLSMVHNWERCVRQATGLWVSVIGDDDYLDPDVLDTIQRVEASYSDADVISWTRIAYNWPQQRPYRSNIIMQLGNGIHKVERDYLHRAMFYWEGGSAIPNCPFCIYHGAVSQRAIQALLARYGEPLFQYPTMDYENTIKLQFVAKGFVYVEKPYSVLGVCPESNSASSGSAAEMRRKYTEFMKDVGRNLDDDPEMKSFPFSSVLGVTAAIGQVQHWYKTRYNYQVRDWEKSFAKACESNCLFARDLSEFEQIREGYQTAFLNWENGRHAKHFAPSWVEPSSKGPGLFTGYNDQMLYIDEDIANVSTPQELYSVVNQIAVPNDMLELKFVPDA